MGYVTNQKNGVSALGLQRVLGLGSYKTAWARHSASPPRGRAAVGERKQSYDRTIGVSWLFPVSSCSLPFLEVHSASTDH